MRKFLIIAGLIGLVLAFGVGGIMSVPPAHADCIYSN
jgi:hypothetical protein